MIIRAWLITGISLIGIAWYMTVSMSPPNYQGSARSAIDTYREAGLMPAAGSLTLSKEIGHDIFEVPKTDADHANDPPMMMMGRGSMSGMSGMEMKQMPGMQAEKMPGMDMKLTPSESGGDHANMPGMQAGKMPGMDMKQMPAEGAADHANMPGMQAGKMPGMDMKQMPAEGAADHANMPGMQAGKMPGMDMKQMPAEGAADHANMPGMQDKKMPGMDMKQMPVEGAADRANMPGMQDKKMPGMDMKQMPAEGAADHANMPGMDMKQMPAEGAGDHAKMPGMAGEEDHAGKTEEAEEEEGGHDAGGSGLAILKASTAQKVDRTIELKMAEWGYTPGNVTVKEGEVIRLIVTNAGNTPHEFMLMTGQAMAAVGYRANRADWNLTEHEAIFEKPIVMPGDRFEMVVKIEKPGAWMFMCMFPYHMQLGMMGAMATEGMEGMSMGGMKM